MAKMGGGWLKQVVAHQDRWWVVGMEIVYKNKNQLTKINPTHIHAFGLRMNNKEKAYKIVE